MDVEVAGYHVVDPRPPLAPIQMCKNRKKHAFFIFISDIHRGAGLGSKFQGKKS